MLEFKTPEINDKKWVDECFSYAHSMNCEYTFGSIYVWHTAYRTQIAHYKDFLFAAGARRMIIHILFRLARVILRMPLFR